MAQAGNDDSEKPSEGGSEAEDDKTKAADEGLQMPVDLIKRIRENVFSFDSFFVTGVENYQADGVLFKGNLRGQPAPAFAKLSAKLKAEVGDDYSLFLLEDQESKPVVAIFPSAAVQAPEPPVPLVPVAALFALVTLASTLNATGLPLFSAYLGAPVEDVFDPIYLKAALPGTLATFAILGAHEFGHWKAAKEEDVSLMPPFLLPAGLGIIGSFGAITNIRSTLSGRGALLNIAASGPAAGAAASMLLVVVGFVLTLGGVGGGPEVEAGAFNDCLLMGVLGQAAFGERLVTEPMIQMSPLLLAGWAGLVINGLNCIPLGELDGGRIAFAIWGRKAASSINAILTLLLGIAGIFDSLALYWILLVLLLQRGPILPQYEELSDPADDGKVILGLVLLALPILTLVPYPFDVTSPGF